MNMFTNIARPTKFFAILILLLVGFFSLVSPKLASAAPVCSKTEINKCLNGSPQNSGVNQRPYYNYWECKDNMGVVIKCNDKFLGFCGDGKIQKDRRETCDGVDFGGKTCKDFGGIDGPNCKLKCTPDCLTDSRACTTDVCMASCGNKVVENGEECEDGVAITKKCSDLDSTYGNGVLTCKKAECLFDITGCLYCGNGKKEGTEVCDGTDFGGKTCKDYGFENGTLRCSQPIGAEPCATIDTNGCSNTKCGNGIIDKYCSGNTSLACLNDNICRLNGAGACNYTSEECDGPVFSVTDTNGDGIIECGELVGSTDSTKDNKMYCGPNCLFDRANCGKFGLGDCKGASSSDWSVLIDPSRARMEEPELTVKGCCGFHANKFYDYLGATDPQLCVGSAVVVDFKIVNMTWDDQSDTFNSDNIQNAFMGWTWNCQAGDGTLTLCEAYKKPICARGVASQTQSCTASTHFRNKAAFDTVLNDRWIKSKQHKYCDGGLLVSGPANDCSVDDPEWGKYNKEYFCSNSGSIKSEAGTQTVRCLADWAPPSICGKLDGQVIKVKGGFCADSPEIKNFFSLINKPETVGLYCAPGNKVVLGSKKYFESIYNSSSPIDINDSWYDANFGWQCQSDNDNGGKGEIVTCNAKLDNKNCDEEKPMCGPAVNSSIAYEGSGPTSGFCAFGTLGGTPYFADYKVTLTKETRTFNNEGKTTGITPATWSWKCLYYHGDDFHGHVYKDKKAISCAVKASVYCGVAQNEIFTTDKEIKSVACGNPTNVLKNDEIVKSADGKNWTWTCEDKISANINVNCTARVNNACGFADGRAYLGKTIDGMLPRKTGGFWCGGKNIEPTNLTLPNFAKLKEPGENKWKWECEDTACSATLLECGTADNKTYFQDEFDGNMKTKPTFMCSNGFGKERKVIATNDFAKPDIKDASGNNKPGGYDPGRFWSCEGDATGLGTASKFPTDKLTDKECKSLTRGCGYLNHTPVPYSIAQSLFDYYKADELSDAWCTNGAKVKWIDERMRAMFPNVTNLKGWVCVHPDDVNKEIGIKTDRFIDCGVQVNECGEASNPKNGYYLQSLLEPSQILPPKLGSSNELLCKSNSFGELRANIRVDDNKKNLFFDLNDPVDHKLYYNYVEYSWLERLVHKSPGYYDHRYQYFETVPKEYQDALGGYIREWEHKKNPKPFEITWLQTPDRGNLAWDCAGNNELTTLFGVDKKLNTLKCTANRVGCNESGFPSKVDTSTNGWDKFSPGVSSLRGNITTNDQWEKCKSGASSKDCLCIGGNELALEYWPTFDEMKFFGGFLGNKHKYIFHGRSWLCLDSRMNRILAEHPMYQGTMAGAWPYIVCHAEWKIVVK